MLITEQNTLKARAAITNAATRILQRRKHRRHLHLHIDFEHGQHWVTCRDCGAQWSANDSNEPHGFSFEEVTRGDGFCD